MGHWDGVNDKNGLDVYAVSAVRSCFLDTGPIPNIISKIGNIRRDGRRLIMHRI
jgi:hypothetical protein